jgi:hypothetical protein
LLVPDHQDHVAAMSSASTPSRSRRLTACRPFRGEVELYEPVKRFLEDLGYEVKGEVRGCDVVAVRRHSANGAAEPSIVVKLKLAFTLGFVLQGINPLAVIATSKAHITCCAPPNQPTGSSYKTEVTRSSGDYPVDVPIGGPAAFGTKPLASIIHQG